MKATGKKQPLRFNLADAQAQLVATVRRRAEADRATDAAAAAQLKAAVWRKIKADASAFEKYDKAALLGRSFQFKGHWRGNLLTVASVSALLAELEKDKKRITKAADKKVCLQVLLVNLEEAYHRSRSFVRISKNKAHYLRSCCCPKELTGLLAMLNGLIKCGYVEERIGFRAWAGGPGRLTRIRLTEKYWSSSIIKHDEDAESIRCSYYKKRRRRLSKRELKRLMRRSYQQVLEDEEAKAGRQTLLWGNDLWEKEIARQRAAQVAKQLAMLAKQ